MLSEAKHLSRKEAAQFRHRLLRWFQKNGRDLPWRRTTDPYAIFVSEVMLQQTQVSTVIPYYEQWLRRFPNIETLALAPESKVLHAWQGLGYYSRARNLHIAAKILRNKYHGIFPRQPEELAGLPGVGRYTANAIATFAFDHSVPIIEANIGRLLARLFNLRKPIDGSAGRKALWQIADALLPQGCARIYNSALIDLGATICTARTPKCGICPVQKFCRVRNPQTLPLKRSRPSTKRLSENHVFVVRRNRILLEQSVKRWRGMWILPRAQATLTMQPIYMSIFPFTNHRVDLQIFARRQHSIKKQTQRWFSKRALDSIPIPSPHRRAITALMAARVVLVECQFRRDRARQPSPGASRPPLPSGRGLR
jgi:A/G-specific adenine glycosylase